MRVRLRHAWESLTSGYWFVPTVMILASAAMAFVLLQLDQAVIGPRERVGWLYGGGADGARTLLSSVAASVITVAGVVFSITIAALTQASSQFGPRLLRNFMSDLGNQVVLGTFVSTFVYCLLVLRTIHGEAASGQRFVPQASITAAVLMAAASIAVLIFFIHHVSASLQAPAVVAAVRQELQRVIARLPEDQGGSSVAVAADNGQRLPPDFEAASLCVCAMNEGYVQAIDYEALMGAATEMNLVLRLEHRPGDYLIKGTPLAHAWPADRIGTDIQTRINAAFFCGRHPTPEQDVEYAIRQLVEIAVRALSPGINDPFTAINCIDALASAICDIARRGLPGPLHHDESGRLRLVTPVTTFDGVLDTAFNQIRQYGKESVAVTIRLLEMIAVCAGQMHSAEQRQALLRHGDMVYRQAQEAVCEPADRDDVCRRWEAVVRTLSTPREASATSEQRPAPPDRPIAAKAPSRLA